MLMGPGLTTRRHTPIISVLAAALLVITAHGVFAQSVARSSSGDVPTVAIESSKATPESSAGIKKPETTEEKLNALEQMLERQSRRLDQMQQTIAEQQETIRLLANRLNPGETLAPPLSADAAIQQKPAQSPAIEDRL